MPYFVETTEAFDTWLDGLKDRIAQEQIASRLIRVSLGNFGDHASLGGGISELRVHIGPGYRAYYTVRDQRIVFVLCGGTKRMQKRDVKDARSIADEIE